MGYNLFLDDKRKPSDAYEYLRHPVYINEEWIVVRNYYAFITLIQKKGIPDNISFDHDLADEHHKQKVFDYDKCVEKTGYHCAKWLIEYCLYHKIEIPDGVFIHSMNPAGIANIKSLFDTYYKLHHRGLI